MCFTTYKKPRRKRATKNIVCYKWIQRDLSPYVFSSHAAYEIGKIYHARDRDKKKIKKLRVIDYGDVWRVREGIHSYSDIITSNPDNDKVIKCIIPKGTPYLHDKNYGEYVSLKVKPIKIL